MDRFKHRHASGYEMRFRQSDVGTGIVAAEMIVHSNIPLESEDERYDAVQANDLIQAAISYAKRRKVPVTFTQNFL